MLVTEMGGSGRCLFRHRIVHVNLEIEEREKQGFVRGIC